MHEYKYTMTNILHQLPNILFNEHDPEPCLADYSQ